MKRGGRGSARAIISNHPVVTGALLDDDSLDAAFLVLLR